jgi:integrase
MSAVLRLVESTGDGDGQLPPIERYEVWMQGRGLATRTVGETVCTLRRLQRETGYPIESTPALAISRFLAGEQLGARARYTYHGHLRGFFRWCADNGAADQMATLPRPRMPRSVPRPITTEQLRDVLALPLRGKTRLMVLLAAFAGLRVHEIAKIKGQDVDLGARTLHVIGKGGAPCSSSASC